MLNFYGSFFTLIPGYSRKSYVIYRTAPFSMTLNDPNPQFQ